MEIINLKNESVIIRAVECLKTGGILIYPTETCYGVGVDATNSEAVTKVLEYKKRPEGKAISIGCDSKQMATNYVEINNTADNIYKSFLPGPVTVISKSKGLVDKRFESENGTLGIRIPDYPALLEIIKKFGKPITTTSANSSGKKTPYSVQDILDNISKKQQSLITLIIDAGELPHNPPSTVIDTTTDDLKTYRQGNLQIPNSNNPNSKEFFTKNVEQTIAIGEKVMQENINRLAEEPVVFFLEGDLGAGKTQFVKGIARALGIKQTIKSPTYIYVSEYKYLTHRAPVGAWSPLSIEDGEGRGEVGEAKLYHLDAWRLKSKEDLDALEIKSWLKPGNVIAIEWPNVIEKLAEAYLEGVNVIRIVINGSDDERKITVHEKGL